MANNFFQVEAPPIRQVMVNENGQVTQTWVRWFNGLYNTVGGSNGFATAGGTYIVNVANPSTPNAQVLASLASGFLKVTTTTGLLSSTGNVLIQTADIGNNQVTTGKLATTAVTAASYGSATQVGTFTVGVDGRLTAAANVTITGTAPGGTAGGDLSGSYPNPTVININGTPLGTTTATDKNILIANGTSWVSRGVSGDLTISNTGITTLATVNANVGSFTLSNITVNGKGLITAASSSSTTGSGAVVLATNASLITPALDTPSAIVLTNATGTAASLTAGHVTTNANLTGPITSVGNATSIASQTGSGTKFVVDTTPTLVTPILGVASATSLAFTSTSELIGTTTNNNAAVGTVGERVSSYVSVSVVLTASNTWVNIASISLTAGDWDVSVVCAATQGSATNIGFCISLFSGNTTTDLAFGDNAIDVPIPTAAFDTFGSIPVWRVSIASTTTVYFKGKSTFTVTAAQGYGRISARRVR